MNEDQKYIHDMIVAQVRMGFRSLQQVTDDAIEMADDEGLQDTVSEEWIQSAAEKEYEALQEESKTWNHPTDTEKLAAAFNELCAGKIIALHNAGYTNSDGEYEVVEIERELRKKGIESAGYCFYHQQDLERAVSAGSLMISYQKINNRDDVVTAAVGREVAHVLHAHGLPVNWDGDIRTKIEIRPFTWQKLYGTNESLFRHSRVLGLIKQE